MSHPYQLRVISSYIYQQDGNKSTLPHGQMGRENRWFHGFVKSLVLEGSGLSEFNVQFKRLPAEMKGVKEISAQFIKEDVPMVICAGTDSAVRWARVNQTIPTLYFGAHAENNGLELIEQENISGIRLNLPLIWKFRNFVLLKELLPNLKQIYFPTYYWSEFAFPNVRANYKLFRNQKTGSWIPGPSTYYGNRSVFFLAERLGCMSYECPFTSLEELEKVLGEIPPGLENAVVGFNDSLLLDGAVNVYLKMVRQLNLPLFWVNNFPIIKAGGVADFSSDFEQVGQLLAKLCLRILRDGVPISEVPFQPDPGETFGLNMIRCRELSINVPGELKKRFQLVKE